MLLGVVVEETVALKAGSGFHTQVGDPGFSAFGVGLEDLPRWRNICQGGRKS